MSVPLRLQRRPTRWTAAGAVCRLEERWWIVFRSWSLLRVTRPTRCSSARPSLCFLQCHKRWRLSLGRNTEKKPSVRLLAERFTFWACPLGLSPGDRLRTTHRHRRSRLPPSRVSLETSRLGSTGSPGVILTESSLAPPNSCLVSYVYSNGIHPHIPWPPHISSFEARDSIRKPGLTPELGVLGSAPDHLVQPWATRVLTTD